MSKRGKTQVLRCTGEHQCSTSLRQPGLHRSSGVAPAGAERPGRTALCPLPHEPFPPSLGALGEPRHLSSGPVIKAEGGFSLRLPGAGLGPWPQVSCLEQVPPGLSQSSSPRVEVGWYEERCCGLSSFTATVLGQ